MPKVQELIAMLDSPNANKRYEACEELRVMHTLPEEAKAALRAMMDDPDPQVVDAATRALQSHERLPTSPDLSISTPFPPSLDPLGRSIRKTPQLLALWLTWVIASTLGLTLGMYVLVSPLVALAGEISLFLVVILVIILAPIAGLLVGTCQWLVLIQAFPSIRGWIRVTALTCTVIAFGWMALGMLGSIPTAIGPALGGASLGAGQWFALRKIIKNAWWWIPASALGSTLGRYTASLLGGSMPVPYLLELLAFNGILSVATGTALAMLADDSHQKPAHAALLSALDLALVAGTALILVSTYSGQAMALRSGDNPADTPVSVAVSGDGRTVAAGFYDRQVRVWSAADGIELCHLAIHAEDADDGVASPDTVASIAFSADRPLLASGSRDGRISVWDTSTCEPVLTLDVDREVFDIAISSDGALVALTTDHGGLVHLYGVGDGTLLATYTPPTGFSNTISFSPGGLPLAIGYGSGKDQVVVLWDGDAARMRAAADRHPMVVAMAFGPDGKTLAVASQSGTVHLWDVESGEEIRRFEIQSPGSFWTVAISPDLSGLAFVASDSRSIRRVDLATGKHTGTLRGHSDQILDLDFSEDGRVLVSASRDHTVMIWPIK